MRVSSFAVAFLMADAVVEAGVCKPARTTTAESLVTSSVQSSTSLLATSTESVEVSLTESLVSATETTSSELIETLTSSTALAETTSTGFLSTVTTEETSIATTTEETSTTTEEASTTITEAGPSATPGSIVGTGPVADQTLRGDDSRFVPLSFTPSDSTQTLIFSLLPNAQLSTGSNGNYLCLHYRDVGALSPLVVCPFDNFQNAPLTCTRASTGALSCSATNGSCDSAGSCRRPNNGARFSQFYVDSTGAGYFGPAGDFAGFTALDLILAG
ncbi:hypothetical protein FIE12Z_1435 [Fusarium flagelliforme]|uniref:Uncharacterized protein n=1 Tax=Fusarium flagelliforme TaxID=2675880 RepID=A0A395N3Z7_9HYPO|nr:hypothetical protein FIE12Z_1435 [Fusarium flagelliforme]